MESPLIWVGMILVFLTIIAFSFIVLIAKQYKRCPSNRVLVIYGRNAQGRAAKTVHGGAAFVIPLLQDFAYLSLEPIQIEGYGSKGPLISVNDVPCRHVPSIAAPHQQHPLLTCTEMP